MKLSILLFSLLSLGSIAHAAPIDFNECEKHLKYTDGTATDSTEGAKRALQFMFIKDDKRYNPNFWKRTRKWKEGELVLRRFEGKDDSIVVLAFDPAKQSFSLVTDQSSTNSEAKKPAKAKSGLQFPDLKSKKNAIYGDYENYEMSWVKDFTGRVIWDWAEDDGNGVYFFCGPEMKDGYLLDQSNVRVESFLNELFSDREDKYMGTSESMHEIQLKDGESKRQLKKLIEERLTAAGAVKMK